MYILPQELGELLGVIKGHMEASYLPVRGWALVQELVEVFIYTEILIHDLYCYNLWRKQVVALMFFNEYNKEAY